jgi:hypothetical protein
MAFRDASRRRRDPTGTGGIRQRFRLDAQRRLGALQTLAHAAVVKKDVLGLAFTAENAEALPGSFTLGASALDAFGNWFTQATYATFVGNDGGWVRNHVRQATMAGIAKAQREMHRRQTAEVDFARSDAIASLAASELKGIADATIQQVVRATGQAVFSKVTPAALDASIRDRIQKVGQVRVNALANVTTIKAFNNAKLDVYRTAGIARVGVNPEWQPVRRVGDAVTRDGRLSKILKAFYRAENYVEVRTAEDDRVCDECDEISLDGPYTLDEAMTLIPAHPNCRCEFIPAWDERYAAIEHNDE